jgi:hypothetical protein
MPLEDWQHHVRRTRAGETHLAWCNQRLWLHDWAFTSIDHLAHERQQGGRLMPCPACLAAIDAVLKS